MKFQLPELSFIPSEKLRQLIKDQLDIKIQKLDPFVAYGGRLTGYKEYVTTGRTYSEHINYQQRVKSDWVDPRRYIRRETPPSYLINQYNELCAGFSFFGGNKTFDKRKRQQLKLDIGDIYSTGITININADFVLDLRLVSKDQQNKIVKSISKLCKLSKQGKNESKQRTR